ncbi:MAG TPA: MerC domain-containing protein [Gammaproteobacteria bacterium]|jgi:hypothetical protein
MLPGRIAACRRMIFSRHLFDQIAIALSGVCLVHCLAVPLLVAFLPLAAISFGSETHFHSLMLWFVVPTSIVGLGLGLHAHRHIWIVLLGALGVSVLAAAALWGHTAWATSVEVGVSVLGSLVLAAAHWLNFREVRRPHRHT